MTDSLVGHVTSQTIPILNNHNHHIYSQTNKCGLYGPCLHSCSVIHLNLSVPVLMLQDPPIFISILKNLKENNI